MNKKDLPLRENYEYIDKFESYEFTHCIVYEFGRRNLTVTLLCYLYVGVTFGVTKI